MSTIRRHGVSFHLLPTVGDSLWLEVIRESDGAVLATEQYIGEGDHDFAAAVEEWFDDIVLQRIGEIEIDTCRACGARRRVTRLDENGCMQADYLVEWEYDLCLPCATHMERSVPWIKGFLLERYPTYDDE